MSKVINNIEEIGNQVIDELIIPIINGSKKTIIDDNKIIQLFLNIKTAYMENKISQFLNFLEFENEHKILSFITNLTKKEKVFFVETINKTIDMDDSLQIFILCQLTKSFKKNGKLNYWEKSLYYNINQISEDDFFNFYKVLENLEKPFNYKKSYGLEKTLHKDELILSIKKLENIGIISTARGAMGSNDIVNLEHNVTSFRFKLYTYSNDIYEMIKSYNSKLW
ncbi:hypothetical protein CRU94_05160 [Arcobacter sp. AHV-9/2010]|uniref:hypothetical protein n=1 Tax=Arcobacter sp. AHV-9/2010 TaxID=2021861 RepID=UPI00100BDF7E|nr:hypothetical protein [Arcobacter sp. CECT 9299]RXJ96002.1 hypothetical protein CRU94_05160 [Arcobacter sp. CECT 9299]